MGHNPVPAFSENSGYYTVKKIVQSPIKMHWYTIFLNRDKGKN